MQYTISQLKLEIFGRVYEVYDIFQNFFGEEYTDLQGIPSDEQLVDVIYACTDIGNIESAFPIEISEADYTSILTRFRQCKAVIMVWWPRVTVTNENDRSVVIQDLYAKIDITLEGRIPYENRGFKLNRTTFSETQFISGYLHSHIPHFSGVPKFDNPCLGRGPINNTIMDLKNNFEDTVWMLFCQELSLYVTVESLSGGPYFRMENIGSMRLLRDFTGYKTGFGRSFNMLKSKFYRLSSFDWENFIKNISEYYLLHGHLSLGYKSGSFAPGMPYFDFIIDISDVAIDYLNRTSSRADVDKLFDASVLIRAIVANNQFYSLNEREIPDTSNLEGIDMFMFKGEMKHLHIEQEEHEQVNHSILLSNDIAMLILKNILRIINYRYKNEHNKQIGSNQAGTSTTYQTVCYL